MQRSRRACASVVTARVHLHRPVAVIAGAADADPDLYPAACGQDQRSLQHQFLDQRRTRPRRRRGPPARRTPPRAAARPGDLVVGQPGLGGQRQPPGQHHPARARQFHRRAQQRMTRCRQAQTRRVAAHRRPARPVPLPLERIRRQIHPARRPGNHRDQSTAPPATHTCASDAASRPSPPSSRRSVPVTTTPPVPAPEPAPAPEAGGGRGGRGGGGGDGEAGEAGAGGGGDDVGAGLGEGVFDRRVSTGCGLTSMKTRCPTRPGSARRGGTAPARAGCDTSTRHPSPCRR